MIATDSKKVQVFWVGAHPVKRGVAVSSENGHLMASVESMSEHGSDLLWKPLVFFSIKYYLMRI